MSVAPIRPEDLETLSDERKRKINALISNKYNPSIGFVEFNESTFSKIIDIHPASPKWKSALEDVRKGYEPVGWCVTYWDETYHGCLVTTVIRFEDAKKFSKN